MKFKLTCACWKVKLNKNDIDKIEYPYFKKKLLKQGILMIDHYYNIKNGKSEKELNKEIEIDSLDDLITLINKYNDQWRNKYDNNKIDSRDIIINFDEKKIMIYNNYIE